MPPWSVTKVSPSVIPLASTADLIVTGENFVDTGSLECIFLRRGNESSPLSENAMWVSSSELTCKVPEILEPGSYSLQVGDYRTQNALSDRYEIRLEIYFTPRVLSMTPSNGPYIVQTLVTIHGTALGPLNSTIYCRFGTSIPVAAVRIQKSILQ